MQMKFAFLIVITIVYWHLAENFGLLNLNLVILFQNFIKMKLYTYHDIFINWVLSLKKRTYTWIFVQSDSQEFLFKCTGSQNKSLTVVTFEFL